MKMKLALVLALALLGIVSPARAEETPAAPPAGAKPGGDLPEKFKNLKVLPADIGKKELTDIMKSMNAGLGVKCGFCHVMEPQKDFAKDTEKKNAARGMMKLTNRINVDIFSWKDAPKATCYMCHHGAEKPVMKAPPPPAGPNGLAPPPGDAPPAGAPSAAPPK